MKDVVVESPYETPVARFTRLRMERESTFRLILTGRCNLACEFCVYRVRPFFSPEVPNAQLVDLQPSGELKSVLRFMKDCMGYTAVHLTGGEATLSPNLNSTARLARKHDFRVHIGTNLVNIHAIAAMAEKHLVDEVTFTFTPEDGATKSRQEVVRAFRTVDEKRNATVKDNVRALRKMWPGITIKANIVISSLTRVSAAVSFVRWCWENGVSPRMQRDRSSGRIHGSTKAVLGVLASLSMQPQEVVLRIPGATELCSFANGRGQLWVKVFNQNFRLATVCEPCPRNLDCDKALSAIRVFAKNPDGIRIALCPKIDDELRAPSLNQFRRSAALVEILWYRQNLEDYFARFCTIMNHQ